MVGKVINGKFVKEIFIVIIKYFIGIVFLVIVYICFFFEGKNFDGVVVFYMVFYNVVSMGDNDVLMGIVCLDKVICVIGFMD